MSPKAEVMTVVLLGGRGAGGRGRLGCLRLSRRPRLAPGSPACVAPVACSTPIWSAGGRSPQPQELQALSETRQGSQRWCPSGLLWSILPPAPSRPSVICGLRTPESVLCAVAEARPTARRFQSIPRDPHAMQADTARLLGRRDSMLRKRVVFDHAADWV